MANHLNDVYVVRDPNGMFVCGDAFWPSLSENIMKAERKSALKDAKVYAKTAAKRLKLKPELKMTISLATEERDDKFNLVSVTLKERDPTC